MNRISTHILDLMRGAPATNVAVRLEHRDGTNNWCLLQSATTDHDGRCVQLLPTDQLEPGVYRLSFDIAKYFAAQKVHSLYPVVEVTFEVHHGESHYHIPLLLCANGYTTYRGT